MTYPLDSISDWRRVDANELSGSTALDPAIGLRVAIHGDTATLHDALDGRVGAFERLVVALARLRASGDAPAFACEVTVVEGNRAVLPQIVDLARSVGARGCIFAAGSASPTTTSAMASLDVVVPAVRQALARCRIVGLQGVACGLPACLLADDADALEAPRSKVDPPSSACLYAGGCALADRCAGLPIAYIRRFGYEAERLRPVHRSSPWPRPLAAPAYAEWRALLGPAAAWVVAVVLERRTARFTLEFGGKRSLVLELTPRDERAPAFARSRTFDLRYTRPEGLLGPSIARIVEPIAAAIAARDDGALDLDSRRDLPPLPLP